MYKIATGPWNHICCRNGSVIPKWTPTSYAFRTGSQIYRTVEGLWMKSQAKIGNRDEGEEDNDINFSSTTTTSISKAE